MAVDGGARARVAGSGGRWLGVALNGSVGDRGGVRWGLGLVLDWPGLGMAIGGSAELVGTGRGSVEVGPRAWWSSRLGLG